MVWLGPSLFSFPHFGNGSQLVGPIGIFLLAVIGVGFSTPKEKHSASSVGISNKQHARASNGAPTVIRQIPPPRDLRAKVHKMLLARASRRMPGSAIDHNSFVAQRLTRSRTQLRRHIGIPEDNFRCFDLARLVAEEIWSQERR